MIIQNVFVIFVIVFVVIDEKTLLVRPTTTVISLFCDVCGMDNVYAVCVCT